MFVLVLCLCFELYFDCLYFLPSPHLVINIKICEDDNLDVLCYIFMNYLILLLNSACIFMLLIIFTISKDIRPSLNSFAAIFVLSLCHHNIHTNKGDNTCIITNTKSTNPTAITTTLYTINTFKTAI